ncbi:MAG: hypothetical protein LBV27_09310 [Oscillospiraceae bacterium]|nr:hypothetical protein [Oscillospiraceae bacterium]
MTIEQLRCILKRLQRPSVLLSLVSQFVSIMIMFGFNINENMIMAAATIVCSMLATLGIVSNPDTQKNGFGDDILVCSKSGEMEPHVMVAGQMVCKNCGAAYAGGVDNDSGAAPA